MALTNAQKQARWRRGFSLSAAASGLSSSVVLYGAALAERAVVNSPGEAVEHKNVKLGAADARIPTAKRNEQARQKNSPRDQCQPDEVFRVHGVSPRRPHPAPSAAQTLLALARAP